jgi:hypothetical protein
MEGGLDLVYIAIEVRVYYFLVPLVFENLKYLSIYLPFGLSLSFFYYW